MFSWVLACTEQYGYSVLLKNTNTDSVVLKSGTSRSCHARSCSIRIISLGIRVGFCHVYTHQFFCVLCLVLLNLVYLPTCTEGMWSTYFFLLPLNFHISIFPISNMKILSCTHSYDFQLMLGK